MSDGKQPAPDFDSVRHPTRTKIVATVGPASREPATLRKLIEAGVDVFRLNFSHGTHSEHEEVIGRIRRAAEEVLAPIAILADLQGPKIRVAKVRDGRCLLNAGDSFIIDASFSDEGDSEIMGCTYGALADEVKVGERILLDDGNLELRVTKIEGSRVHTQVVFGGVLRSHKGINLPGTDVRAPSLSEKDRADLAFALSQDVDFMALSFVRRESDLTALKNHIAEAGATTEVIAKIERPEAVENMAEIVQAADGIMVARGDMGVELGPEAVPGIQKKLIRMCIAAAKPVITATQMLESMVENPRPTRAEVSDVANAIYDGTSAIMLSAETATGIHPIRVVETMDRIAQRTEKEIFASAEHPARRWFKSQRTGTCSELTIAEGTVRAAAMAALEIGANVIVTFTESGRTAKLIARERLPIRLVAVTTDPKCYRRLALQWGINPMLAKERPADVVWLHRQTETMLVESGHLVPGDLAVFIAGEMYVSGATNTVRIRVIKS